MATSNLLKVRVGPGRALREERGGGGRAAGAAPPPAAPCCWLGRPGRAGGGRPRAPLPEVVAVPQARRGVAGGPP